MIVQVTKWPKNKFAVGNRVMDELVELQKQHPQYGLFLACVLILIRGSMQVNIM